MPFAGGRQPPSYGGFYFVFSELSTGSSLLLLVILLLVWVGVLTVENCFKSHKPVEISDLRPCGPCLAQGIPESPIRRAKAADGPLRGRVGLATLFFHRCDGVTIGRSIGDLTIGLRTKVPVKIVLKCPWKTSPAHKQANRSKIICKKSFAQLSGPMRTAPCARSVGATASGAAPWNWGGAEPADIA